MPGQISPSLIPLSTDSTNSGIGKHESNGKNGNVEISGMLGPPDKVPVSISSMVDMVDVSMSSNTLPSPDPSQSRDLLLPTNQLQVQVKDRQRGVTTSRLPATVRGNEGKSVNYDVEELHNAVNNPQYTVVNDVAFSIMVLSR